jgi:hypothetical protein
MGLEPNNSNGTKQAEASRWLGWNCCQFTNPVFSAVTVKFQKSLNNMGQLADTHAHMETD